MFSACNNILKFIVVCSQYEGQFFYDTRHNKVHIAVPEDAMQIVAKELEETSFQYQIDAPIESWSQKTASRDLRAGSQLLSNRGECFLFGGTVLDKKTGITVAHPVRPDEVISFRPQNGEEVRAVIGQCLAAFQEVLVTTHRSETPTTADVAVLDLHPDFHLRRNLVQWPRTPGREFRIKIYKGPIIPSNTEVMVLDQLGRFRSGVIRRHQFIDTSLERRGMDNLYSVLGIGTEGGMLESAITQRGDSGALVLSVPTGRSTDSEDDVLYVYGIVILLYSWTEANQRNSLTIANSLGDVIPEVFVSENVVCRVCNVPVDSIDFTDMAEVMDQ